MIMDNLKTNKQLAIIGIENIIRYMRNKCTDQSTYNLDKQLNRGSYSISFRVKDRMNNEARKTIYFSIN